MLQPLWQHCINNALYQTNLPLSNSLHDANEMCPPELLHTLGTGLNIYRQEALQGLMSSGASRDDLDAQHVRMYNAIKTK